MTRKPAFRRRSLGLGEQRAGMRQLYGPRFVVRTQGGTISWRGRIQPAPICREYLVDIEYTYKQRPLVRVLEPRLERPSPDVPLPHVFDGLTDDPKLCLHFAGEWRSDQRICDTIVPWAAEWLFHYEAWLVTGMWSGGGIHLADVKSLSHRDAGVE